MIRLAFFWMFLPCFCMLIWLLPPLGLGSKSTSLSPGFCVCRSRQYDTICWKLDLISGFFVLSWLIVWADGINKCGWCLAGGRGYWLKGPHEIPDPKCNSIISSFLALPHLLDCLICTRNAMPIVLLLQIMGEWDKWGVVD